MFNATVSRREGVIFAVGALTALITLLLFGSTNMTTDHSLVGADHAVYSPEPGIVVRKPVAELKSEPTEGALSGRERVASWLLHAFANGIAQHRDARSQAFHGKPASHSFHFDTTKPFASCPVGAVSLVGGTGDGSKWVCGIETLQAPCLVLSLGSNNDFRFEEDVLARTPCVVATFDCTSAPKTLSARHMYFKQCLGSKRQMEEKPDFVTLDRALELTGKAKIDLLKMDIEGFEYDVMATWGQEGSHLALPVQVVFEVHVYSIYGRTPFHNNAEAGSQVLMFPPEDVPILALPLLFTHLGQLGYGIVNREQNPLCPSCMEYTIYKF
eukprot:c4746_g1_i1.p1 GENE.c4746_g1_i1~~c4746_g1_i1.p1  ORF type:complete len:350 (-),score=52.10 c4746_g1_i1:87-1067(-)